MNKIKEIKLDQTNWLEVTWVNVVDEVVHCESFGDSNEYQELLRQRLVELNVETTQELESILEEQVSKRHIPTEEELEAKRLTEKEYLLQMWKAERAEKVANIEVVYNNVVYQGDEVSQDRMSRAITALPDDTTTVNWVAKDNSIQNLTRVDLVEILRLSSIELARIWVEGRPE